MRAVRHCLTRQDEVLQSLDTYSPRPGIEEEDVCGFQSFLATRTPKAKLAIVLLLLLRWPLEDGLRLSCHDLRHLEVVVESA